MCYIGMTKDVKRRWGNECSFPLKYHQKIQEVIRKYGKDQFTFEILESDLSIEQAEKKEEEYIQKYNSVFPNGYNISRGKGSLGISRCGSTNPNARFSQEEIKEVRKHSNEPIMLLYQKYKDRISYQAFRKIYYNTTYHTEEEIDVCPYSNSFSLQFTSSGLTYEQVVEIRNRYKNGEYWKSVYEDYKHIFQNPMSFWNMYNGHSYKFIMPEVFTKENKKKHGSLAKSGSKNGRAKINEQDVKQIRSLYKDGMTLKQLYELYPQITQVSVRDIINHKTWKNIL